MRSRASMLSLAGLALAAACATGATPSTGTAEDEAALRANGDSYVAAWNARDAAAIRAMLADEYHEVTPDGRHLASPADVEASMTAQPVRASISSSMVVLSPYGALWPQYAPA